MSRRRRLTVSLAQDPVEMVQLHGLPYYFSDFSKGSPKHWLQYIGGELRMVHRTSYTAKMEWDGKACHEIRVEYYEPEFPDAKLTLFIVTAEYDTSYEVIRWTQYYPGPSANSVALSGEFLPKVLKRGDSWVNESVFGNTKISTHYSVGGTYTVDIDGRIRHQCIRLALLTGTALGEHYIDADGNCQLQRFFKKVDTKEASEQSIAIGKENYEPAWEAIPDSNL